MKYWVVMTLVHLVSGPAKRVIEQRIEKLENGAQIETTIIAKSVGTYEPQKTTATVTIPKADLIKYRTQGIARAIEKYPITWQHKKDKQREIIAQRQTFVDNYVNHIVSSRLNNQYNNPDKRFNIHGEKTQNVVVQKITEPVKDKSDQLKNAMMRLDMVERILGIVREHVLVSLALRLGSLHVRDLTEKVDKAIVEDRRILRGFETHSRKVINSLIKVFGSTGAKNR